MEEIPAPLLLDPDRVMRQDRDDMTTEDHRSQAQLLDKALHESCAYAQHLWNDLAAVRQYLHDSLPPELGDGSPPAGASPSGPDDEQGWQRWIDAFAEVTSVLCGPHGDNGFGRSSATLLAQARRKVTVPVVGPHADASDLAALTHTESDSDAQHTARTHADPPPRHAATEDDEAVAPAPSATAPIKQALLAPLLYGVAGSLTTVFALRGRLRRRP